MIPDFGSILDRLQGSLGKGYLLGGILPVALSFGFSIGLAYIAFETPRNFVSNFLSLQASDQVVGYFTAFAIIALVGFILWTMNTWLRATLEGRTWPSRLRECCETRQQNHLRDIESKIVTLHSELFLYRRAQTTRPNESDHTWTQRLSQARAVGSQSNRDSGGPLTKEFNQKLHEAQDKRHRRQPIPFELVDQLVGELETQLEERSAHLVPVLDKADQEVRNLIKYASGKSDNAYSAAIARRALRYPEEADLGPTRLANAAILHEDYMLTRYGMSAELFWPGIEHHASKDESFLPLLEQTKTRLDVSVAMAVVIAITTFVWSILLILFSSSMLTFLLVSIPGIFGTVIFYEMALHSFRSFSETVRSAVDLFRFDLLRALHITLPQDSDTERELWKRLTQHAVLTPTDAITYEHIAE